MKFITSVKEVRTIADKTVECVFEKPVGFTYKAGQYVDIKLINPPENDDEGAIRTFSLASSPQEDYLAVAFRVRDSAFKQVITNTAYDVEVEIDGPIGSFVLHQNIDRPAIFLVGGIGITPFRSIIKDVIDRKTGHRMYLFYSNRAPKDATYLDELAVLGADNDALTVVPTMTDAKEWDGEIGYIATDMINRYVAGRDGAVYYSAGPQAMVSAMKSLLNDDGVSDDDIRVEEFAGY